MKLSSMVTTMILLMVVLLGILYFYSDLTSTYGTTDTLNVTRYTNRYDVSSELTQNAQEINDNLLNKTTTETTAADQIGKSTISALKVVYDLPNLVYRLLSNAAEDVQAPAWMVTLFWSLVIIGIGFAVMGAFLYREL